MTNGGTYALGRFMDKYARPDLIFYGHRDFDETAATIESVPKGYEAHGRVGSALNDSVDVFDTTGHVGVECYCYYDDDLLEPTNVVCVGGYDHPLASELTCGVGGPPPTYRITFTDLYRGRLIYEPDAGTGTLAPVTGTGTGTAKENYPEQWIMVDSLSGYYCPEGKASFVACGSTETLVTRFNDFVKKTLPCLSGPANCSDLASSAFDLEDVAPVSGTGTERSTLYLLLENPWPGAIHWPTAADTSYPRLLELTEVAIPTTPEEWSAFAPQNIWYYQRAGRLWYYNELGFGCVNCFNGDGTVAEVCGFEPSFPTTNPERAEVFIDPAGCVHVRYYRRTQQDIPGPPTAPPGFNCFTGIKYEIHVERTETITGLPLSISATGSLDGFRPTRLIPDEEVLYTPAVYVKQKDVRGFALRGDFPFDAGFVYNQDRYTQCRAKIDMRVTS